MQIGLTATPISRKDADTYQLPDVELSLIGTTVIDERLVLLDYRVGADRCPNPGIGSGGGSRRSG